MPINKLLLGDNIEKEFTEIIKRGEAPRLLYKYRSLDEKKLDGEKSAREYTIDGLENNYLWFSEWESLNDACEGKRNIKSEIAFKTAFNNISIFNEERGHSLNRAKRRKQAKNLACKNALKPTHQQMLAHYNKIVRVCCFSKYENIVIMWAHYSDSNKGICLEFDCLQDPMVFHHPVPIQYMECLPQFDFFGNAKEITTSLMSHKTKVWEDEEEHRVLKFPGDTDKENTILRYPFDGNKVDYKPEALKSVIFGCNASEKKIEDVKKTLIKSPHIVYKKCHFDSCGKLEIKQIQ